MTAFYELKPNKILSYTYNLYVPISVRLTGTNSQIVVSSSFFYLYDNPSTTSSRTFYDENGNFTTGSADYSGSIFVVHYTGTNCPSDQYFSYLTGAFRLQKLYQNNTVMRPDYYDNTFLNQTDVSQIYAAIFIPSILYGSEIKPGSICVNDDDYGPSNPFVDDGFGAIQTSGTLGFYFLALYQHGVLILYKDNAGSNVAQTTLSFSATYKVPQNIYIIDVPKGEANFTTNSSYVVPDPVFASASVHSTSHDIGNQKTLAIGFPKTYITTIGLYDEDYEMVGIVKLSTPLYHDEKTPSQIRAKLNF